jgi:hypothetical protein
MKEFVVSLSFPETMDNLYGGNIMIITKALRMFKESYA